MVNYGGSLSEEIRTRTSWQTATPHRLLETSWAQPVKLWLVSVFQLAYHKTELEDPALAGLPVVPTPFQPGWTDSEAEA